MAVRVPSQASTKWWILLAAVLAMLLTYWQHRDGLGRETRSAGSTTDGRGSTTDGRGSTTDGRGSTTDGPGFLEIEIVAE